MSIFSPLSRSSRTAWGRRPFTGRGFTLIELLVVIAVLVILASIMLVSLQGAQAKTRDARRLKDLETLQGAVELYYRDFGHYPLTGCPANGVPDGSFAYTAYQGAWSGKYICPTSASTAADPGLKTLAVARAPYIPTPLKDSSMTIAAGFDAGYEYRSDANGTYCVLAFMTPENMNNFDPKLYDLNRCGTVGSNGKCSNTSSGKPRNAIYVSTVPNATGC